MSLEFVVVVNSTAHPYKDLTLNTHWDNKQNQMVPQNVTQLSQESGVTHMRFAFLTTEQGKACQAAWGGVAAYSVDKQWGKQAITEFTQKKGGVVISFGGESGTYLQESCTTPEALTKVLAQVVGTYKIKSLDFDIEGAGLTDTAAIQRLAQALAALGKQISGLDISVTLPVLPSGLTVDGINVIKIFDQAGVKPKVNIMAMDFGQAEAPDPGMMGKYVIEAAQNTYDQLVKIDPSFKWSDMMITPMIGVNDVHPEHFTLEAAQKVYAFAQSKGATMSFWSLDRDHPCDQEWASATCSGAFNGAQMQTKDFEFSQAFAALQKSGARDLPAGGGIDPLPVNVGRLAAPKTEANDYGALVLAGMLGGAVVFVLLIALADYLYKHFNQSEEAVSLNPNRLSAKQSNSRDSEAQKGSERQLKK